MRRLLFFGLMVSLAACGGTLKPNIEVQTQANADRLGRFRTYSHTAAPTNLVGWQPGAATPEVLRIARARIDADLQAKGFAPAADETGDLIVRIAAGTRKSVEQPSAGGARAGASATSSAERAIVVDIIERDSKEQVLHGYAHYAADPGSVGPSQVEEAVTKIMGEVPPAK